MAKNAPDPARKPRADSVLKQKPREMQDAVMARIRAEGSTYEAVRSWLKAEFDLRVSVRMLSEFRAWYELRERMEKVNQLILDGEEMIREANEDMKLGLTQEQIMEIGNQRFMKLALATSDAKLFTTVQDRALTKRDMETKKELKVRDQSLKERNVVVLEQKLALLQAKEDKAKATLDNPKLSAEQKNQRLKEVYGIA